MADKERRDHFSRWDLLPTFCGFAAGARVIASVALQ